MRGGKSSELIVAGQLLRLGLDVYLACLDDQAMDLLIRVEANGAVTHYDVQVKSVKGYNRIIGIRNMENEGDRYILIIHYRHENKRRQVLLSHKETRSVKITYQAVGGTWSSTQESVLCIANRL